MLIKYYRSYSTFRNIFNTLVISLLVSIILLAFILSAVFSSVLTRQTNDISTRMLSRLTFMINQIYTDAYSIMLSLGYGENVDLNTMMFSESRDRLRDYSGFTRMRLLQTIYPGIAYIGVYNGIQDELMCTVGLEDATRATIREAILARYSQRNTRLIVPMTNETLVPLGFDPEFKTLTLMYYSPLSGPDRIGAIFVGIDCEYLGQFIKTVNENDNQMTFLVDEQGKVLSHPDYTQIFADYRQIDYVQKAASAEQASGFFFADIDQKKNLVTYLQDTELGWTYITLTPYDEITLLIRTVNYATILVSLIILLAGSVLSLMAAKKTFNPIAGLLTRAGYRPGESPKSGYTDIGYLNDQFSNYIESINTNEALLLNHALESLLLGAEELDQEKAGLLDKQKDALDAPFYMICLLNMTRSQHYRDMARKEKQYHRYTLAQFAEEYLAPITIGVVPVFMTSNSIALIVRLSSYTVPNGLVLALIETRKRFHEHSQMTFSAAVSGIYNDLYVLQDAYDEALQLMTERYFTGDDDIFQARARTIATASYNSKLEHEIWSAIKSGSERQIESTIRQFVDELRSLSYEYARHYISQLSLNIIAYSLAQTPHQEVDPFGPYKRNLEYSESLNDSLDQLLQLCRQIATLSQQNEDTSGSDQMDHAMLLAQERYMDPGFSTNIAAQEVGLSITYFNRQFRRKTGQSYSTYLNNYRLNVASSLLCTTSLSMSRICQNVGLTNESYFYSLFKREFGVTPHQYRSLHKECKDQTIQSPP